MNLRVRHIPALSDADLTAALQAEIAGRLAGEAMWGIRGGHVILTRTRRSSRLWRGPASTTTLRGGRRERLVHPTSSLYFALALRKHAYTLERSGNSDDLHPKHIPPSKGK